MACIVASAMVVRLGDERPCGRTSARRSGSRRSPRSLLGLAALVLQVVAWTQQGFGPADGGFASVYFGWTAFLFLFVLGTLFWLETVLATSTGTGTSRWAPPASPPGHASGDPDRMAHDIRNPVELNRAALGRAQLLLDVPGGHRRADLDRPLPASRWAPLPLVVCGAAALLYALGRRGKVRVWREVSFYSGVAAAFVVLEPPFDGWADKWLAAHMSQHVVLMTVVPPLVVLGRPWPRLWLPFPLSARRAVGGALSRSAVFRRGGSFLMRPPSRSPFSRPRSPLWHVPVLYDAAGPQRIGARLRARVLRRAGPRLLGRAARRAARARAHRPSPARDLVRGRDGAGLDPRHRARVRIGARLRRATPSLHRPAARRRRHVGAGLPHYFVFAFAAFYRWLEPSTGVEPRPEELSWT